MRLDRAALLRTTALVALAMPAHAQLAPNARPSGGVVSAGQATIALSPGTTTINQQSQRASLNWQSFDVGGAQTVQFKQPGSQAVALNRVLGGDPSQIGGRILANGQVVLINQSGVVFTRGSQVDTAGLVVSASGMSDRNFMAGRMVFDQAAHPGAIVSNAGNITIRQAGLAALVAPQVSNSGVITATMGRVVLGGAVTHTLDLYGDGLVALNVTGQVTEASLGGKRVTALVTNSGTILAPGGSVVLTAAAIDGVVTTLVTAGGTIAAATAGGHAGRVLVQGIGGGVEVDGDVSAAGAAPGTAGGQVAVNATGAVTVAAGAAIDASGAAGGGAIAIGTTMARAVRGPAAGSAMTARSVTVAQGASVRADATVNGRGGRIALLSRAVTAQSGILSTQGGPKGGDGGWIEVSGEGQLDFAGRQLTGAPAGHGGTLYIDPADLIIGNSGGGTSTALITPAQFNAFQGDVIIKADGTLSVTANATLNAAATSLELFGGEGILIGATLDAHAVPVTLMSTTGNISDQNGNLTGAILAKSLQAFTRGGSVTLDSGPNSYSSVGSIAVSGDTAQGLVATLDPNTMLTTRVPDTRDAYQIAGVTSLDGAVDLTDIVPLQIFFPIAAASEIFIDDNAAAGTTVLAANITANTIDIEAAAINQSLGLISTGSGNGNFYFNSTARAGGGISIGGTITDVVRGEGFGGTVSLSTISGSIVEAGSAGAFTGLIIADALQATATGAGGSVALDNSANAISTLLSSTAAQSFSLSSDTSAEQGGLFVQGTVNGGQTLALTSSGITLEGFEGSLTAVQRIVLQADSFDLSAPVNATAVLIDRLTPGTLALGGTNDSFGTAALGNITSTILALGTTNGISPGTATGIDIETALSSTGSGTVFTAFAHQDAGAGGSITINAPVTYGTIGLEADSFSIGAAVTASGGGLVGVTLADAGTLTIGGAASVLNAASLNQIVAGTLSLGSIDGTAPGAAVSALSVAGRIPFTDQTVALFAQGDITETAAGLIFAGTLTGESAAGSIALPSQNDIGDIGPLAASTGISVTVSGEQTSSALVGLAITGGVATQTGTIAITSAQGAIDLVGTLQANAVALFAEGGDVVETIPEGGPDGSITAGALSAQAAGDVLLDNPSNTIARIAPVAGLTGLSATGTVSFTDSIGVAIAAPVTSGSGNVAIDTAAGDIAIGSTVQSGTETGGVFSGTVTLFAAAGNIVESVAGQPGFGTIQAGTLAAQANGKGGNYNITLNNPAGNDVAIIGPAGNFAGLEASGDIAFIGGQALSVAGFVMSNAGSVAIETTAGNLALGGTVQSGAPVGGVYTGTATFVANAGNITETLPSGRSATGTILAGAIAAQAGFGAAAFDIVFDDAQNNQIGAIAAVGSLAGLSATGRVLFENAQALAISGDVLSGSGSVQITTLDGDVALGGILRAGTSGTGTATIVAEAGDITETLPGAPAATGIIEAGAIAASAGTELGVNSILLDTAAGNAIGTIAVAGGLAGLSAGGTVELINARSLTVAGDVVSTSGPVELTTLAGDLVIAGTVQSGTLSGGAYGGTAILLAQAGNITETASGSATTGAILAGTLAAQAGTGGTSFDIVLDSQENTIAAIAPAGVLAGLSATGDVAIEDARALSITGDVLSAGGDVMIGTTNGGVFIGGTIQSGLPINGTYSGTLVFSASAGISETLPGATAPAGIILTGDLAAETVSGNIALDNTAGNEIAAIDTLAGISASGNVTIVDDHALNVSGGVFGANVSLTTQAGDLVIGFGTVQAGTLAKGQYSGTASLVAATGNVASTAGTLRAGVLTGSAAGSFVASTPASASAGNQVAALGAIDAGSAFSFVDGMGLSVTGAVQAGGPISMTAPSLRVNQGGSLAGAAGGLVSLIADSFVFDGAVSAPGGILALDILHDGSITVGGQASTLDGFANLSAGTIALGSLNGMSQSPGNTGPAGGTALWTTGSAGSVTVLSIAAPLDLTGNASVLGLFSNGSIVSDGGITVGTLTGAAGSIKVEPNGTALITGPNRIAVLGSFTVSGAVADGGGTAFELTDDEALTVAGPVIAASPDDIAASGGVTIAVTGMSAGVFNGLDLGVSKVMGSGVLLTADGSIKQAGGSITTGADVTPVVQGGTNDGTIVISSAQGGISAGGTLIAEEAVLLSAAGDITQGPAGSVQAIALAASASGSILLGNENLNHVLTIIPLASEEAGLTLSGLTAGGDILFGDEPVNLALGNFNASTTVSGANVTFALSDQLTQMGGTITALGSFSLPNGILYQNGGLIRAGGDVNLGFLVEQTNSAISAGGNVTFGPLIQYGSSITAAGNIQSVSFAEIPIFLFEQSASTIEAGGSVTLRTQGSFAQSNGSTISGGSGVSLQADQNGVQDNSSIQSGGPLTIAVGGTLSLNAGTLQNTGAAVTLSAGSDLTAATETIATPGLIQITAATQDLTNSALSAGTGISLTADGSDLNDVGSAIVSAAGTIALSAAASLLQSGGTISDTATGGRILLDAPGTVTIGGALAAPNIVIGGMAAPALVAWNNATIQAASALGANGLKQALSGGLADTGPGLFVTADRFVQNGTTSVTPLGTPFATVQIALTPGGSIDFGNAASSGGLQAPSGELLLLLGTGTATGNVNVADLGVAFSQGGSATLTGSVSGLSQFAAAGAGVAFPSPDLAYTLNGCEIGGAGCGVPPVQPPLPFQIVPIFDPVAELSAELLGTDLLDEAVAASAGRRTGFLVVEPEEDAFVGTVRKRRETDDVILPDVGTVDY